MTQRQINRILTFYHKSLRLLEEECQRMTQGTEPDERLTRVFNGGSYALGAYPESPMIFLLKEHRAIVREIRLLELCSKTKDLQPEEK